MKQYFYTINYIETNEIERGCFEAENFTEAMKVIASLVDEEDEGKVCVQITEL